MIARDKLMKVLDRYCDFYSAKTILGDASAKVGLAKDKAEFSDDEVRKIAGILTAVAPKKDAAAAALAALAAPVPPAAPVREAAPVVEAASEPAPEAPAAEESAEPALDAEGAPEAEAEGKGKKGGKKPKK